MEKEKLKRVIANNIMHYRHLNNVTQSELAQQLNYSDKSISKWERAEGIPDVFVLVELSAFFGVTINDLVTEHQDYPLPVHSILNQQKSKEHLISSLFYTSIVWLVITAAFGVIRLFDINYPNADNLFIYAIPVSMIVLLILNIVWHYLYPTVIVSTALLWTLALSLSITFTTENNHMFYIMAIPIQILLFLLFIWIYLRNRWNQRLTTKS